VKERERRRKDLGARLEGLEALERQPVVSQDTLSTMLQTKLREWQGPLKRHVTQARQLLRKVLIGRLTVTPHPETSEAAITGPATLEKFVKRLSASKGMASPTGSDGEWMPIDGWLAA
jgi:hypothetical protein